MPIFEFDNELFSEAEIRIYTQVARLACLNISDACAKGTDTIRVFRVEMEGGNRAGIVNPKPGEFLLGLNHLNDAGVNTVSICHELLHYDQIRRGDLKLDATKTFWKGQSYDQVDGNTDRKAYLAQPWEAEAHSQQVDLIASVTDCLTVSDRLRLSNEFERYLQRLVMDSFFSGHSINGVDIIVIDEFNTMAADVA